MTNVKDEAELVKIASHPASLYEEYPLTTLTAYSLYWLHKWQLPRTIESIAVLNWRLFPEKFAMVGYPQFPDAFRTNRSLLQMQPKYRNLLTGAAVKGFNLNQNGNEKAEELNEKLGAPKTGTGEVLGSVERSAAKSKTTGAARSIEPAREVARVRESKLFNKWTQDAMTDRDLIHVHALLKIFDHTPATVRIRAMKELQAAATKVADDDVTRFLTSVQKMFPQIMRAD